MTSAVDIAYLDATVMSAGFHNGSLSPVDVHDAVVSVIEAREPVLNALCYFDPAESRRKAEVSAERWRRGEQLSAIDGVPGTVKENVARVGVPMQAGNAGVEPVLPEEDAPITQRLEEAGMVIVGSTVMPDWGMLSSGVSSLHGITRSPLNPALTTGGSSSGAGAAAAGGYGPLHVGTDIGGSVRLPGTWLGLFTLKPSYGRVALDAPYIARVAGPMTRSVADSALMMAEMSRPDERDWLSLPQAEIDWTDLDWDPRGARVAVHLDAGCGGEVEAEVADAVRAAGKLFANAGAEVEFIDPFLTPELLDGLDMFLRIRSWKDFYALPQEAKSRVLPYVARWCGAGADISGRVALECFQDVLEIQRRTWAATRGYDVVLSPVAPTPAFPAERPMPYEGEQRTMHHIGFTAAYSMSGQPAASVNVGHCDDGRTLGVQISGRRFDDLTVLRAAQWLEQNRPLTATPIWPSTQVALAPWEATP